MYRRNSIHKVSGNCQPWRQSSFAKLDCRASDEKHVFEPAHCSMFEAEMHLGPYTQSKILLADTKKHDEEF
jgi:hypothetical protein